MEGGGTPTEHSEEISETIARRGRKGRRSMDEADVHLLGRREYGFYGFAADHWKKKRGSAMKRAAKIFVCQIRLLV